MKISSLIVELVKFRFKGFKLIDFWVGGNLPPSDFCDFIIIDCKCDKSIILRNWYLKDED